jgi:hypothetical protein
VDRTPLRLLSVRNRVITLTQIPQHQNNRQRIRNPFAKLQMTRIVIAWGVIGIGSCGVLGWAAAPLVQSLVQAWSVASAPSLPPAAPEPPAPSGGTSLPVKPTPAQRQLPIAPQLLPSTRAEQRLAAIAAGRRDPFGTTPPVIVTIQVPPGQSPGSSRNIPPAPTPIVDEPDEEPPLSLPPPRPAAAQIGVRPTTLPGLSTRPSGAFPLPPGSGSLPANVLPPPVPSGASLPNLPNTIPSSALTQPRLACDLEVSGVMRVSGRSSAIIKTPTVRPPDATYVRTVQIGDRLCNGRVIVRDIIDPTGPQAGVMVEQGGQLFPLPVDSLVSTQ